MKKVSIMALILVLAISLTGCFGGEAELYKAFNKMQDIRTMESETELSFNLEGEGFSPEEEMILQQIGQMLNTTKFNIKQKSESNEDQTIAKAEAKMEMNLGGMIFPINVWVDADLSEDQFKMVQVYELPQMLMAMAFPQIADKQYLVQDFDEIMNMTDEEVDMQGIMELSKELEPKIMEFIEEIQEEFKPEIDMVEKKESKEIDGEKLTIYEVKLNDETLRELVKYTVDYILENESVRELMVEFVDVIAEVAISQGDLTEEDVEEAIGDVEEELANVLPELQVKFHEFMEEYKDVEILGENGIKIELGIDKKGYIVHEEGTIDLRLDLANIAKAMGEESVETGVINFAINYKTKMFNINNEDVKVEMPETNEENSISYMKLMEMFEEQLNSIQTLPAPEPTLEP